MFPWLFWRGEYCVDFSQYFIGDRLTDIYGKLKPQIDFLCIIRDYEKYTEEEISERAEEVCENF